MMVTRAKGFGWYNKALRTIFVEGKWTGNELYEGWTKESGTKASRGRGKDEVYIWIHMNISNGKSSRQCLHGLDWLMAIFKGCSRIASAERRGKWLGGKATFLIRFKDNYKLILPSIVARWMNSSHTITIPCYHITVALFRSYKGRIGIRHCRELLFTDMEKTEDRH